MPAKIQTDSNYQRDETLDGTDRLKLVGLGPQLPQCVCVGIRFFLSRTVPAVAWVLVVGCLCFVV